MKKQMKRFGAVLLTVTMTVTSFFMEVPQDIFAADSVNRKTVATEMILDDFEDYADKIVGSIWRQDGYGDAIEMSTATGQSGSTALAYKYIIGDKGYTGAVHYDVNLDLKQYKGISLWLKQDGSGNSFTVQFKSGDDVWEARIDAMRNTSGVVELPFDSFRAPSWGSGNRGTAGDGTISQIGFFINGSGNGMVYIDDLKAYGGPEIEVDEPSVPSEPSVDGNVPSQGTSEPSKEAANPSEEESRPSEQVSIPSEKVSMPSEEESRPSVAVSTPSKEESSPSEEEREPSEESKPSQAVSEPSREECKPSEEESRPSVAVSTPSKEESRPSEKVSEPSEENKPSQAVSEPSKEASRPSEEVSKPSVAVSMPSKEESKPTEEVGQSSEEESRPSREESSPSGKGSEPAKPDDGEHPSAGSVSVPGTEPGSTDKPGTPSDRTSTSESSTSSAGAGSISMPGAEPSIVVSTPGTPSDSASGSQGVPSVSSVPEPGTAPGSVSAPGREDDAEFTLSLGVDAVTLKVGEKRSVKVFANGKDVTKEATFTPSEATVVKIEEDNAIEGIAEGSTDIQVQYKDAHAELKVVVFGKSEDDTKPTVPDTEELSITGIRLLPEAMTLVKGESLSIGVLAIMSDGSERLIKNSEASFKAKNSSIISVDEDGTVKGKKVGNNTFVTVTYKGYNETCVVQVINKDTTGEENTDPVNTELTLSAQMLELKAGQSVKVSATATPDAQIEWLPGSPDVQVIQEENGKSATIQVSAAADDSEVYVLVMAGNTKKKLTIKIKGNAGEPSTLPTDKATLKLNRNAVTLYPQKTTTVTATVTSTTVSEKNITWKTSNSKVATAVHSNGKIKITARGTGVAYITVSVRGAVSRQIKVTVKPANVTNLKQTSVKANAIRLSWKKLPGIVGYRIRCNGKIKTTKNNSCIITGLKANKRYKVTIQSYRKTKDGTAYGNTASIIVNTKRK